MVDLYWLRKVASRSTCRTETLLEACSKFMLLSALEDDWEFGLVIVDRVVVIVGWLVGANREKVSSLNCML